MKTKLISLLVLLCWLPMVAGAQEMSGALSTYDLYHNLPGTPTAVSLARSINCPVDHRTGVVDVKIPLYELEVNDIKIPIYLSYHSSGVKVRDPFSWVGAGWTLHAEPTVTRTVLGAPDENWFIKGEFKEPYKLSNADRYRYLYEYGRDHMPDRFYYSLPEKSGEFFFKKYGTEEANVAFHPYEPFRISWEMSAYPYNFTEFTLTDDQGLIYEFGKDFCGYTSTAYNEAPVYSEWKCVSMRSPHTGTQATFNYQSCTYREPTDNDFVIIEKLDSYTGGTPTEYVGRLLGCSQIVKDSYTHSIICYDKQGNRTNTNLSNVDGQFPTRANAYTVHNQLIYDIACGDYVIDFKTQSLDGYQVLDEIVVWYQLKQVIKRIKFHISRMNELNVPELYAEHCKLDSIHFCDNYGNSVEKYKMEYIRPDLFPNKYSRALDHWGYYNATLTNTSLVPSQLALDSIVETADREPHATAAKYGTLLSITYPTGGKTKFEYELHHFETPQGFPVNYDGAGLRVKSITEIPLNGSSIRREYAYEPGLCRYPPLRYENNPIYPYHLYFSKTQTHYYYFSGPPTGSAQSTVIYYPSHPLADPNFVKGTPVEYSKVTETISDSLKTVYEYENAPFNDYEEPPFRDKRLGWKYGYLKRRTDLKYNSSSGVFETAQIKRYEYTVYNSDSFSGWLTDENTQLHGSWTAETTPSIPYYEVVIETGANRLSAVSDSIYDKNGHCAVKRTEYRYTHSETSLRDGLAYERQKTEIQSDGNRLAEYTWYPSDVVYEENDKEIARQRLLEENVLATPIGMKQVQDGTPVQTVGYGYVLDTDSLPRLSSIALGRDTADVERIRYSHHTPQGKPMEKVVDGVRSTVYLYSYNGERLLAEIKNADYATVSASLGGASAIEEMRASSVPADEHYNQLRTLASLHPEWYITLFRYEVGCGVSRLESPGTTETLYGYDNFNRLRNVSVRDSEGDWSLTERIVYQY